MQFQVPQFIEIEDKIFGPLTIRQFIYLVGGAGMCYIAFAILPLIIAIPVIGVLAALAIALAFFKYNDRPFINLLESAFKYQANNRLYLWKKAEKQVSPEGKKPDQDSTKIKLAVPKLSEGKLRDLAWSLDIRESQNPLTGGNNQTNTR